MNPCLMFTLTTAASLVAMSPATEMRDVREEDGRAGSALAEEHRGTINNSSEAYQQRALRKRSPAVPVPFPIGDLTIQQLKALKKGLKKLSKKKGAKGAAAAGASAAATTALLSSGNPVPGVGSTIPLGNPVIPSGASFSGPLTVLGVLLIGASIVMALTYFRAQNNLQNKSDYYGQRRSGFDSGYYDYQDDAYATVANIASGMEASNFRYRK